MREPKPAAITSPYAPDIETVRAWIEAKIKTRHFVVLVTAIVALILRMREINLELAAKLAHLKRRRPPSETLERLQRQLVLPLFDAPEEKRKRGPKSQDRSKHPGRGELPGHLPRIDRKNPVADAKRTCPMCGAEMESCGFAKCCEYLDIIPAQIVVVNQLDETVRCTKDGTIVKAEAPARIVEDGKLGDALIIEALCDKYIEHAPIERQATRLERQGVDVAPQTLGRAVLAAIDLLEPIAKAIHDRTLEPGVLGTDASSIPILDPKVPMGIRSGTMWCWTNARWVSFAYSPSGDSDSVKKFLRGDCSRTVQCDGTSVTSFIERAGGKRPGCWSHARRRFVEAARAGDKIALEALRLISPIFAVEKESTLAGDNAGQRRDRRQHKTKAILDELRAWVDDKLGVTAPKSPLGKALGYVDRQWPRLILFLNDGNVEATNNRRERELRRLVLGRKNWLFTWDDLGGSRTANILTIIATAIAHDVNPRAYLHIIARKIVDGWPQSKLRDLLPDRIRSGHPELFIGERDDVTEAALSDSAPGAPSALLQAH